MKFINLNRLIVLTLAVALIVAVATTYAHSCIKNISGSVLRLHILANSNSEADQSLKLKVRDRVISETTRLFEDCKSSADAQKIAIENQQFILQIAEDEIRRQGFDYPVNMNIGNYPFPTRNYSGVWLPKGNYRAIRIEIGKATGQNWWCVMYPPLCFTDDAVKISASSDQKLRSSLGTEEYNLITQADCGTIPVEIRFKIVEIFQDLF